MKDYFTVYCTMCAFLHDIGKQFIPPSILQKNSPLTDEEYSVMKTHTTIGYQMCTRDEKLRPYSAGPLYHHEALDGTGYPNGVAHPDLPLEGQIIRVADEFDAITSKRQYKSHIGVCDTLKILIEKTIPDKEINPKMGKVNPKAVKALIKVICDDTEYEIYNLSQYINYLQDEISRLEKINLYEEKMNKASKEDEKIYYLNGIKQLFSPGENLENYPQVLEDYKQAYEIRKNQMDNLYSEFKTIKKLKV